MTHKYILDMPSKCLPDLCLHPINWRRFHFWTCRPHTESRDLCMPLSVRSTSFQFSLYISIYAFSRHFYPKRLTVHSGYTFFCQYVCSLGIKPTTFALLTQFSYHWATGTQSSLQISHGYDYVFNRLCQKQVEAWFYVFNAGCGIFCQPCCHLYDIFCG